MTEERSVVPTPEPSRASVLRIQSVAELQQFATVWIKSGLGDDRSTVEETMIKMATGMELGLSPVQSCKDIAVINKKPTLYGDAITALLLASGKLEDLPKIWYEGTEGADDYTCVCELKRVGMKTPSVGRFSLKEAKVAGLIERAKGQKGTGPWITYQSTMLMRRAFGFAARLGFADVLKGLWVREEAEDLVLEEGKDYSVQTPQGPTEEDRPKLLANWKRIQAALTAPELAKLRDQVGAVPLNDKVSLEILVKAIEVGNKLLLKEEKKEEPPAATEVAG